MSGENGRERWGERRKRWTENEGERGGVDKRKMGRETTCILERMGETEVRREDEKLERKKGKKDIAKEGDRSGKRGQKDGEGETKEDIEGEGDGDGEETRNDGEEETKDDIAKEGDKDR